MKLQPGQWFMWGIDHPLPDKLTIYQGSVKSPTKVTEISRYQAMALIRHHPYGTSWHSYKRGEKFIDVRVCGDLDAWYGEG